MNSKKNIFIVAIGLLLSLGCSEDRLIELPVDNFLIGDAVKSENDMRSLLNGVYDQYSASGGFGADVLIFGDLISDNVFITSTNTDVAYRNTGFLNWSSDISDFGLLDPLYNGIVLANTVINNNSLPETTNVLNLKGEAKIARAFGYYYLAGYYAANPTLGSNQEYGVPLNLGNYDPNIKLPRATVAQTYDQIIADLTSALSMMTNEQPVNKGFLSPTAARLLLSRVYLTRGAAGDYEKSIQYANAVINSAGSNSFDFVSKENYVTYFSSGDISKSENQEETVWEINMNGTPSENSGVNNSLSAFYENTGSKKRFLFTQNFYSTFKTTDVRRSLFTTVLAPTQDNPRGLWTRKYVRLMTDPTGGNGGGNFTQNVKIMRMSEAYLNKIEALYKSGNTAQALVDLNIFATSRDAATYTEATLENILNERRKEFFAEGQRFFDLKRNNLGFSKPTNCYSIVCEVPGKDKLFVLPVPFRELSINTTFAQYPGW